MQTVSDSPLRHRITTRLLPRLVVLILGIPWVGVAQLSSQEAEGADSSVRGQSCIAEDAFLDAFIANYRQMSSLDPIWDTFRWEHLPFVLVYSNAKCAAILHQGKVLARVALESPMIRHFNFLFSTSKSQFPVPAELQTALKEHGINHAFVWNLSFEAFKELSSDQTLFYVLHEGFHLMYRVDTTFAWPRWVTLPYGGKMEQRKSVGTLCYEDSTVAPLLLQEQNALTSAVQLLLFDNQKKAAIAKAKEFIRFRHERYAKLKDVRVVTDDFPQGMACGHIEAIQEMDEGAATYAGEATLLKISSRYKPGKGPVGNDVYYTTGSFQLLILQNLIGTPKMAKLIRRIAQSDSWEHGIFYEFSKELQAR